jgi:hypothetical protein
VEWRCYCRSFALMSIHSLRRSYLDTRLCLAAILTFQTYLQQLPASNSSGLPVQSLAHENVFTERRVTRYMFDNPSETREDLDNPKIGALALFARPHSEIGTLARELAYARVPATHTCDFVYFVSCALRAAGNLHFRFEH